MRKVTRRNWLAAAGATTAAVGVTGLAGTATVFAQEATPASKNNYNFQDISPRELIQRRHLPNVELITQDNQKVRFYTDSGQRQAGGYSVHVRALQRHLPNNHTPPG